MARIAVDDRQILEAATVIVRQAAKAPSPEMTATVEKLAAALGQTKLDMAGDLRRYVSEHPQLYRSASMMMSRFNVPRPDIDAQACRDLYREGMTVRQIAQKFGCTEPTVKRRLTSIGEVLRAPGTRGVRS